MENNASFESPGTIFKRLHEAYNRHDHAEAAALYAIDGEHEDIALSHVARGRDAVAAGLAHFFTAFPDAHWHALDDLETTDRAMGRYVLTATLQRDMGNLKAAGQRLQLRGVHILETAQGLIQRSEDFWDSKTFHNQMNTMNTGAKA
jgi:steroid delta-isomerase-like uncharacterized protein